MRTLKLFFLHMRQYSSLVLKLLMHCFMCVLFKSVLQKLLLFNYFVLAFANELSYATCPIFYHDHLNICGFYPSESDYLFLADRLTNK